MLRASAITTGIDLDLRSVGDHDIDPGRADAVALLRFADAVVGRTSDLADARAALVEVLGADAVVPAAGAAGNFEMMNRLVDAVGVVVPRSMYAIGPEIGFAG